MRIFVAVVLGVSGCYQPTFTTNVPCGPNGTCPTDQQCDFGRAPPTCVTQLGDAGPRDAPADSRIDSPVRDAPSDAPAAVVPIAYVQSTTSKPSVAVTTLALANPVAVHDAIIVCLNFPSSNAAVLSSITDTLGNSYLVVVGPVNAAGDLHYVAVAANSAAGADTLTVTLSATPASGADLFMLEYSGLAFLNPFDVTANSNGNGTAMSSGPATTTKGHELVLGYAEAPSASVGAGFTLRSNNTGNIVEDNVVTTTGSYDATATTTTGAWTMIMATFKGR